MFNLLLEESGKTLEESGKTWADWITKSFPTIRVVLMSLIILLAIAITVIVMCMESNPDGGTNVISGQSDSFYAKNQGSSKEGRLKTAIIVCSITLAVLAIAFWVLWAVYPVAG